MRRRQADLHARVNGNVRLDFGGVTRTSYAGLGLFARYLRNTDFNGMVRAAFAGTPSWGDVGVVGMVRVLQGKRPRMRPIVQRESAEAVRTSRLTTVIFTCDGYCFEWWTTLCATTPSTSS